MLDLLGGVLGPLHHQEHPQQPHQYPTQGGEQDLQSPLLVMECRLLLLLRQLIFLLSTVYLLVVHLQDYPHLP